MTNTEKFKKLYTKLELSASKYYNNGEKYHNKSFIEDLKRDKRFNYYKTDYCKEFRNNLIHDDPFFDKFVAEPTEAMIEYLENIIHVLDNPVKITDIWTQRNVICSASLDDKILLKIQEMHENDFTYIPILNDGTVIGIFSENIIFKHFVDQDDILVDRNSKIHELEKYLPLEKQKNVIFDFVKRDVSIYEVGKIFEKNYEEEKRTEMVFVTHSGNKKEKILGIITPWDYFLHSKARPLNH